MEEEGGVERHMPVVNPNPTAGLERVELRERIDRGDGAIVGQQHRTVLVLHEFVRELEYKEIAKRMKCSIGTVMSRLFYCAAAHGLVVGQFKKREFRMKHELELKVQAGLDGELPDQEARRFGEWIARDAEACPIAPELGCVRPANLPQEAPGALGESREFYWSKIQRQIQHEADQRRTDAAPWYERWRRYLAPISCAAALACVVLTAVWQSASPTFSEISSPGEEMEAVTFHDQSAQMTVVWLQDNSAAGPESSRRPRASVTKMSLAL